MTKTVDGFRPAHDFLVCIDSDGCAFDVMELKHKECFCPATVNAWELQAVSRYAREAWDFVNLYSVYRGINRFTALELVLELLEQRREVRALTGFTMPEHKRLKEWIESGEPLNHQFLERHQDIPELKKTLEWSLECNHRIKEIVRGVPPFPFVRESLEALALQADIVIVSATSTEALMREWEEHGLIPYVSAVCGQEAGSKADCIARVRKHYASGRCLMIGDAPGDKAAAGDNGILFYPVLPLREAESWKQFHQQYLKAFISGTYGGEAENIVLAQFDQALCKKPSWA